ncbi:MAG: cell wall hydrolase [Hespellia sp.]|nr:cell wall hydrolase [Hespellia sp.]
MKSQVKRKIHGIIAFTCVLTLGLSSISASAADTIESLEGKTSELQNQLSNINGELLSISNEISDIQMQVEITNGEIERTEDDLAQAQANEASQYEDMKSRIKYMYETGNATFLEMLFTADDMSDFLNKADFIQNISEYDRKMLTSLQETKQQIADAKATLEEQQASLSALQNEVDAKQASLEAKAAETQTNLETYTAQLEQARAEEAARQAAEAQAAAEAAALAASSGSGVASSDTSTTITGPVSTDSSDLDVFAAILDCEALSDYTSMLAVATVIMNRYPRYGSISAVVYAPGQFEPVWTGKLDRKLSSGPSSLAYQVAQDALDGARLSAVADCYYFLYAPSTSRQGIVIGDNLFFPSW